MIKLAGPGIRIIKSELTAVNVYLRACLFTHCSSQPTIVMRQAKSCASVITHMSSCDSSLLCWIAAWVRRFTHCLFSITHSGLLHRHQKLEFRTPPTPTIPATTTSAHAPCTVAVVTFYRPRRDPNSCLCRPTSPDDDDIGAVHVLSSRSFFSRHNIPEEAVACNTYREMLQWTRSVSEQVLSRPDS